MATNRGALFHLKKLAWSFFAHPLGRAIVMTLFAVPASFLLDLSSWLRRRVHKAFFERPELHDQRVLDVQRQVKEWKASGSKKTMRSARAPWLSMSPALRPKGEYSLIDCSALRDIIEIDEERMVVKCEPMVDMATMTEALVPRGLAMAIQIEMEDITVGGLLNGMGMETNSHKYGLIHETLLSVDIVTGTGELIHATRDNEYSDLFTCIPWSHGSLGFVVCAELQLIRIKPFMHVKYICCYSLQECSDRMNELAVAEDAPDYLECTVYTKETSVIQCGYLADVTTEEEKEKINPVNSFWKTWYYVWVESFLHRGLKEYDEFIPIKHYYHRYSRSIFWELRDMIPFANHPLYRLLFGWMGAPKVKMIKLLTNDKIRWETMNKHVVQDLIIPLKDCKELIEHCHQWFEIYPMLFFATRFLDRSPHEGLLRNPHLPQEPPRKPINPERGNPKWQMYFDLGIYGIPEKVRQKQPWDAKKTLREMEAYVRSKNGYMALYCDTLQTRDELRVMFEHSLYDKVREKYGAIGAFPELYEKIKPEAWLLEEHNEDDFF